MTLRVPGQIRDAMVVHARNCAPEEACGLLAGDPGGGSLRMAYPLTNRDHSPVRYTIEPEEHFRAWKHAERCGWELVGAFHSHPTSAAVPSSIDVGRAYEPDWTYVIVGLSDPSRPEIRAFRIADGMADEVPVVLEG